MLNTSALSHSRLSIKSYRESSQEKRSALASLISDIKSRKSGQRVHTEVNHTEISTSRIGLLDEADASKIFREDAKSQENQKS